MLVPIAAETEGDEEELVGNLLCVEDIGLCLVAGLSFALLMIREGTA